MMQRRFPPPWSVAAARLSAGFAYQSKLVNHSPTVITRTTATAMSANATTRFH